MQIYLGSKAKIIFSAVKVVIIKAYTRLGRPSPFNTGFEENKKEVI